MIFTLASQMWPSCPYKPLSFQTLRYPQFLSNFQSGKKNVGLLRQKNQHLLTKHTLITFLQKTSTAKEWKSKVVVAQGLYSIANFGLKRTILQDLHNLSRNNQRIFFLLIDHPVFAKNTEKIVCVIQYIFLSTGQGKGQIISKAIFVFLTSPKNQRKNEKI